MFKINVISSNKSTTKLLWAIETATINPVTIMLLLRQCVDCGHRRICLFPRCPISLKLAPCRVK